MTDSAAAPSLLATLRREGVVSGECLARRLGVSRARVWQIMRSLREDGFPISALTGVGYRWDRPFPLLDPDHLARHLPDDVRVDVHWRLGSTNDAVSGARHSRYVCFAERQAGGRGRVGRVWSSPPGGLYFSVGWLFDRLEAGPQALSPWVSVHLAEALAHAGVPGVEVKWPNDLVAGPAKLAGVLIELAGDPFGRCHVCVGVGVNWFIPDAAEQPATGITALTDAVPGRNDLAGNLAAAVVAALASFVPGAPADLPERWRHRDALAGRAVTLSRGDDHLSGRADGVSRDGALRLWTRSGLQCLAAGETRLRPE